MIAVGVDTHKQRHYAVALDRLGQLLGELSFAATAAGYVELQRWAEGLDEEQHRLVFGIECAGSWAPGSASTCSAPVTPSLRSSVRVDRSDAPASPIASTRWPRPSARLSARMPRRRGAVGFCQRFELC